MNCPLFSRNRNAFTLLELVVALAIASIVALSLSSILHLTIKAKAKMDADDQILSNVNVIFDVISHEIDASEAIIDINRTGFPLYKAHNIGFVLQQREKESYKLITFYLEHNKLFRYTLRTDKTAEEADYRRGSFGINAIAEGVMSLEGSSYNEDAGICTLKVHFLNEEKSHALEKFKKSVKP